MAIKYEAYTRGGERVTGVLDTDSKDAAYTMLEEEELTPYKLRQVRPLPSLIQLAPWLFKPKPQEIIDFTRQLSSLLDSGIPLRRALIVQRDQARGAGLKAALQQVTRDIEAGERFSEAFSRHPTVFPEFYRRMLTVGESTGGIPFALQQLSENLHRRREVAEKVRKALVVPAISMVVAFFAGIVMVTYSIPALTSMLSDFKGEGELPTATRALITISGFLQAYTTYIIGTPIAVAVLGGAYSRTPRGKRVFDRLVLRLPVVGKVVHGSGLFSMTTTAATLLKAGVPTIEALQLTEQALGNTILRERLADVTRRASEGTKLADAFEEQGGFPLILPQAIAIGELRGSLVDTLDGLAKFYEDVTESDLSAATEMIQPVVTLVVAGIVGFMAVALIQGIYSTLERVQ